ncbi:LysR family transcriptional regulator [bacterium D16-76]|nr:LysR family transcriptional regulator [bacterium D16-76]
MEIRVLRYFLEIAREESMTRAAQRLHISQPTLSKQIKDLEHELGKKLFRRTNYSVKLTDEGMRLRKRAEDILDMVDKTAAEFQSMDQVAGGDVYIGCSESQNIRFFAQCAKALQGKYPDIRFHLYSGDVEDFALRLDQGLLDFAIVVEQVDFDKYNALELPGADTWGVLMRKDSPLAKKEAVEIEDLFALPLICSRQSLQVEYPRWLGERLDSLHVVATFNLTYNAAVLVREGLGYVLAFDGLVDTSLESALCFRPLTPRLESKMYVVWRKYQMFSPAAQLLLEELTRRFGGKL